MSTDWNQLWKSCYARARRPRPGLLLPESVAVEIAREAFAEFMQRFSTMPEWGEALSFLDEVAERVALQKVAEERRRTMEFGLWHDPEARDSGAVPEWEALIGARSQARSSAAWQQAMQNHRALLATVIRRAGVPEGDVDDVLAETFASLFRESEGKGRLLDRLIVYEQLTLLLTELARRRAADYLRKIMAAKRREPQGEDAGPPAPEEIESVAAPRQLSLRQIYDDCRECLTPFQWELVITLFWNASANRKELLERRDVCEKLGVKANTHFTTKWRKLNAEVETALAALGACLGPGPW